MGMLSLHPIAHLQRKWGLGNFIETGTWEGDGLMHALQFPFMRLRSVEASVDLAAAAAKRIRKVWACDSRWEIIQGDSVLVVPALLRGWNQRMIGGEPTLWWLDAHLPDRYGIDATHLPLEREVEAIVGNGAHARDVFIMDDWRLYEDHTYDSGLFPRFGQADGDFIRAQLEPTHHLMVDTRAEGALYAVPLEAP